MAVPNLTPFSGAVPNSQTMQPDEYSQAVDSWDPQQVTKRAEDIAYRNWLISEGNNHVADILQDVDNATLADAVDAAIAVDAIAKPTFNMLKDGGALIDPTDDPGGSPNFNAGILLGSFNGSIITENSRFISNNSTYGGTGAALSAVIAAMTSQKAGKIWCAANIQSGGGTGSQNIFDGETYYLANYHTNRVPAKASFAYSIIAIDNDVVIYGSTVNSPVVDYQLITPADGEVFVYRSKESEKGYNFYPGIWMKPNSNCAVAKLQLVTGLHKLDRSDTP